MPDPVFDCVYPTARRKLQNLEQQLGREELPEASFFEDARCNIEHLSRLDSPDREQQIRELEDGLHCFYLALNGPEHCSAIPQSKANRGGNNGGKGTENAEGELKQTVKLCIDALELGIDAIKLGIYIVPKLKDCFGIRLDLGP